jgi:hypothetical protein
MGKHVGTVGRDGRARDPGVEDAPDAGHGSLRPHPTAHRSKQVGAAGQRSCDPIEVGDRPDVGRPRWRAART